jgi:imidazolonepropionase-like amidohydrolase
MRPILLLAVTLLLPAGAVAQEPIVIRTGVMITGRGSTADPADIVVRGSQIIGIRERTGRPTYDLSRYTVMPGGIDTHVHIGWHFDPDGKIHRDRDNPETPAQTALYGAENAYLTVKAGITTVQSLGAGSDRELRDAIERGIIPGPRIITSLDPLPRGDTAQLRRAVRERVAAGADVIKIFASESIRDGGGPTLTVAELEAACGEAAALGRRAVVHAHASEAARRASAAGCTQIEHGALLDQEALTFMAARGVYLDPNLHLVFQNYFDHKARFLGVGNYTEAGFAAMEKAVPAALKVFKLGLATPGLEMVFGTDAVAGAHGRNWEELIYRVREGGQDPMSALVSATSLAAESMGLGSRIGTLAPTYEADIIAVDGNPLQDITALRRVVFVMRAGRVIAYIAPGTGDQTRP